MSGDKMDNKDYLGKIIKVKILPKNAKKIQKITF